MVAGELEAPVGTYLTDSFWSVVKKGRKVGLQSRTVVPNDTMTVVVPERFRGGK
jgi:hypothetical protein